MKKENCSSLVPFLDVVDFYLRKAPVSDLPPAWKEFRRAALESMGILHKALGPIGPQPSPQCVDTPKYSKYANPCLEFKIPVIKLRQEIHKREIKKK